MNIEQDLISYWELSSVGATVTDQVGNYDLTRAGPVPVPVEGPGGSGEPTGVFFDNYATNLSYYYPEKMIHKKVRTVMVWLQLLPTSISVQPLRLVTASGDAPSYWNFSFQVFPHDEGMVGESLRGKLACGLRTQGVGGAAQGHYSGNVVIADGDYNWHLVGATYDPPAGTLKWWIDGQLDSTTVTAITNPEVGNTISASIQQKTAFAADWFEYNCFSVGYWNRELTPAEVSWLYNGGNARYYDQITGLRERQRSAENWGFHPELRKWMGHANDHI